MPAFRTTDDVAKSLRVAKLTSDLDDIVATARPAILFVRQQVPDDPLPVGASKIGGFPDLPADFAWPQRPAYPDADRRADALRRRGESTCRLLAEVMNSPGVRITQHDLQDIRDKHEGKCAFLYIPFPLAFVGQLGFEDLAKQEGFDPCLPRTGLLSIFSDTLSGRVAVFWHDQPICRLKRTVPPQGLVDYFDTYGPLSDTDDPASRWRAQTKAEVLHPFPAVTVSHHWKDVYPRGSVAWKRVRDWFSDGEHRYRPQLPAATDGSASGDFGDRLGGWPSNIQGDPEAELEAGPTQWRHIFSYGAEHYAGTRLMPPDSAGDGNTYVMIRQDHLAERRFDKAGDVYQQT